MNVGSAGAAVAAAADTGSSPWVVSGGDIYFGAPAGGATETFAESFERGTVGSLPSASTTSYDHTIGDNVDAAFDAGGVSGQCVLCAVPDEELSAPIYAGQKIDYLEDGILTNPQVRLNVWVDEAVNDTASWPGPLSPAGDVGIGTSTPRHKLDVKGDASFDGDVVVTGTLTASNLGSTGSIAGPGYGPPPGGYLMPSNLTAISTAAVTPGVVTFVPVDVGPRGLSAAALVVSCSAAEVGGTTSTVLGVYPDDGSGGLPDCSNGPLVSGQVTLNATGVRSVAVSETLPPGRYWAACGYFVTAPPGTLPKVTCNNQSSSSVTLWNQAFPAIVRYLFLAGRTSLPLAPPSGFSCGTDGGGIVVGVRAG